MAHISYPTQVSLSPPLLIEGKHLTSLDVAFDEFLTSREAPAPEGEVESPKSKPRRPSRTAAVYLSGGRTIKSDSSGDVIKQPHVSNEVPLGFRTYLETAEVEATVALIERWRLELEINVSGDERAARELFGSLENWASEVAAPRWQQLWAKSRGVIGFFLLAWLVLGLVFGIPASLGGVTERNEALIKEAHGLLQRGVDDSNQRRAIELTLALVSDYNQQTWKAGPAYWGVLIAGALALSALLICPLRVIGIWGGKRHLEYWKVWVKVIWVTVPGLIFTSILWPRILTSLKLP